MTPRRRRQLRRSLCRAAGRQGVRPSWVQAIIQGSTFERTDAGRLLQFADLNGKRYLIGVDLGFQDRTVQAEVMLLASTGLPKVDLKSLASQALQNINLEL